MPIAPLVLCSRTGKAAATRRRCSRSCAAWSRAAMPCASSAILQPRGSRSGRRFVRVVDAGAAPRRQVGGHGSAARLGGEIAAGDDRPAARSAVRRTVAGATRRTCSTSSNAFPADVIVTSEMLFGVMAAAEAAGLPCVALSRERVPVSAARRAAVWPRAAAGDDRVRARCATGSIRTMSAARVRQGDRRRSTRRAGPSDCEPLSASIRSTAAARVRISC